MIVFLKMSHFILLNHLVRLGGKWSPARLAAALQVTKAAVTNNLKRLEARGLVFGHLFQNRIGRRGIQAVDQNGRFAKPLMEIAHEWIFLSS